LIARIVANSGLSRSQFIRSLGYRSVEGGLRRLDEWLETGRGDGGILDRLVRAYHVDPGDLEKALVATVVQRASEQQPAELERLRVEHEGFRQYIHVEGEFNVPSGICAFGITGGHGRWTTIPLPQALAVKPLSDQMPGLIGLMNEYLTTYKGFCPFFGKVTGFRLVRWNDSIRFSPGGEFMEYVEGPFHRARMEMRIGK